MEWKEHWEAGSLRKKNDDNEVGDLDSRAFEFVKDRLYYVALKNKPKRRRNSAFFCIDNELVYWNFFLDFGPLNLAQLYRFCQILLELLHDPKLETKRIYYFSSTHSHKRANAAFLISSFAMLYLNRTPEEAYAPFANVNPPFPPFHDASASVCTYKLTILDCLRGIHRARVHGFFDLETFDVEEYEHYERVEYGDLNWIVKDKFLAFAGPVSEKRDTGDGYETFVPEDYIPYFKKNGVGLVIRLNKRYYDERRFTRNGIKHADLYYLDGTVPSETILQKFLALCEEEPGAIAVHCKAGLGRTGTCIGCYLMKHYGFSAAEAIGWMRVCRPGSVIGPQQHFLEQMEEKMKREGEIFRSNRRTDSDISILSEDFDAKFGLYPSVDVLARDEISQGDELRSRKSPKSSPLNNNIRYDHHK